MRTALLVSMALLVGATRPAPIPLNDEDFRQLMDAAVAASSTAADVQPHTATICVQKQLGPALEPTRGWIKTFQGESKGVRPLPTGEADASLSAAMSSNAAVAKQTSLPSLPRRFVVFGKTRPRKCVIPHNMVRGPNWRRDESIVALSFTRPALADGYAFIEEYEECPGLCGTTYLRVFRKQNGKWTQVARSILSVS
jgi:hypothetical protein